QLRGEKTRGGDEVSLGWRFGRYETSIPAAELARPTGHPLRPGVTPEVHDDGLAPGPEIPAGAACPGDAVPGALPDDPAIQRAAAALLLGR
ncbi:MAG: hypothetical protein NDI82_10000, partial [Anaeromyxobacteraceae bacterium]|nr:hypothetical protein [Anaeromyxobacteraceae bacterium]